MVDYPQVIAFAVPGVPIAQPRIKATSIGGYARVYTPKTADAYKASIAKAFIDTVKRDRIDEWSPRICAVSMEIQFIMPRPKSMIWRSRPMPQVPHTKRPDGDNLAKAVLDSLLGLAWVDDAQVYDLTIKKFISSGSDHPRTLITICYG